MTAAGSIVWQRDEGGRLMPSIAGSDVPVAWAPQPGSQEVFLSCPVTEALYEGNRGGGKTDALLMDYAQFVGRGYGADWRGILFRRHFGELKDIIEKANHWFPKIFPEAIYSITEHTWRWPTGEKLIFAAMERPEDYGKFHGHSYPWIGWEELTNWATDECYRMMISLLRSTNPSMPRHVRSTTNPGGVGHNWVKERFGLPVLPGRYVGEIQRPAGELQRVAIHSQLSENALLLAAEPGYADQLRTAARSPAQLAAWLAGDWDIVAGGMIDDVWRPAVHIVPPIPMNKIPASWRLDRSYDDGQSKPFSVGWWGQSNGEPVEWEGRMIGPVRGDLVRLAEWYGWNGTPNVGLKMASRDIARGIVEREVAMGVRGRVKGGPADSSIFAADPRDPQNSIAAEMARCGVSWERADKSPGTRKTGWKTMRDTLKAAIPDESGRREQPGLFISSVCAQFRRTIPILPRDDKDPDDVDTEAEDHIADEVRYRLRRPRVVESRRPHLVY